MNRILVSGVVFGLGAALSVVFADKILILTVGCFLAGIGVVLACKEWNRL